MRSGDPKRREERVKLFATLLSNLGVVSISAGVIAPLVAGVAQPVTSGLAVAAGFGLHLAAQFVLEFVVKDQLEADR